MLSFRAPMTARTTFSPISFGPILTPYPPFNFDATLRTKRMVKTAQFEYCLTDDGKIWTRYTGQGWPKKMSAGNLVFDANARIWHLHDGAGIPMFNGKSVMEPDEYIVGIDVQAEVIVALTNSNRFYMYRHMNKSRKSLTKSCIWSRFIGQPFPTKMKLPTGYRDWAFGVSVGEPVGSRGQKRNINAIHQQDYVGYYTDRNGTRHAYGNTSTVYVLLNSGQELAYWDTGLSGFARGFRTPEAGTVIGQSISAAGSTILLCGIDANGNKRYFTRQVDYESNGSCPGLKYTYTEPTNYKVVNGQKLPIALGEIVSIEQGVRGLPLKNDGWREHFIFHASQDDLSCKISIQMTGMGDSGRQLYIAAIHPEHGPGYYTKNINALKWTFVQSLTPFCTGAIHPMPTVIRPLSFNYSVTKTPRGWPASIGLQLNGFHTSLTAAEPCYIAVSFAGQSTAIKFHVVDGWRLLQHADYQPDVTGTDVEPEMLRGTVVLSPEQLRDNFSPLGRVITHYFKPYHSKTNQFIINADDSKVKMRTIDSGLKIEFGRERPWVEVSSDFYVDKALAEMLRREPRSLEDLHNIIKLNKSMLAFIKAIYNQHRSDTFFSLFMTLIAKPVASLAGAIMALKPSKDPRRAVAAEDVKPLLNNQIHLACRLVQRPQSYSLALEILRTRINALEAKVPEFEQAQQCTVIGPGLRM